MYTAISIATDQQSSTCYNSFRMSCNKNEIWYTYMQTMRDFRLPLWGR